MSTCHQKDINKLKSIRYNTDKIKKSKGLAYVDLIGDQCFFKGYFLSSTKKRLFSLSKKSVLMQPLKVGQRDSFSMKELQNPINNALLLAMNKSL